MANKSLDQALQSKELQKFFSKVMGVIMMPKDSKLAIDGYPTILILLNENDFIDFKDYTVDKNIVKLLDDKYPILHIELDETRTHAAFAIRDVDSGLNFWLPDQPVGDALFEFLKDTEMEDKIPLMLGMSTGGNVSMEPELKKNVLLVLDGYFID
jgi:hypothetical protein